jgi:hypothetical protein
MHPPVHTDEPKCIHLPLHLRQYGTVLTNIQPFPPHFQVANLNHRSNTFDLNESSGDNQPTKTD